MVPANKSRFKVFKQLTGCAGPMGLCVDDLVIGMKAQSDPKTHYMDPNCAPCPWRELDYKYVQENPSKIKIGILKES
jgi:Asp-tRNA(Asn)/Glu-tRNA(Gln) amidotransferase A subunit family amidase